MFPHLAFRGLTRRGHGDVGLGGNRIDSSPIDSWLSANRFHSCFIDRAMEFAGPALMSIVFVRTKSVDDKGGVTGLFECAEERTFPFCLLTAKREVPLKLQTL